MQGNTYRVEDVGNERKKLIDPLAILLVLRERWLGAISVAVMVCAPIGWYVLNRPAIYESRATLLVERSNDRVVDIKQVTDQTVEGSMMDTLIQTHIEQMKNHSFITQSLKALSSEDLTEIVAPFAPKTASATMPAVGIDRISQVEKFLSKNYEVSRIPKTLLISVSVRHRRPDIARRLADLFADQYITYLIRRTNSSNTAAMGFLEAQAEEFRKRVETAERSLQEYREKFGIVSLADNQNITIEKLKVLNIALTNARVFRLSLDAKRDQARALISRGASAQELSSFSDFSSLASTEREIDGLRARRVILSERYGDNHPLMQENALSLSSLEARRKQQLSNAMLDQDNQCSKALAQEHQLEEELAAASKENLELDRLAVGFNILRRDVETAKEIYGQILSRQNETNVASQLQNTNIKSVDRAFLPEKRVDVLGKNLKLLLIVIGTFSGLGYCMILEVVDTRVRTSADVESFIGVPTIAEIPSFQNVIDQPLMIAKENELDSEVIDAYRGLYSQLRSTFGAANPKIILVTSTVKGEGKSYNSANIARTFARHGHRTLLLDADFRNPSLFFKSSQIERIGLKSLQYSWDSSNATCVSRAELPVVEIEKNFFLLPAGGRIEQPTEFIVSKVFSDIIEHAKGEYDKIVIDTPPAGLFPDAQALTRISNCVVYICRYRFVSRERCRMVFSRLMQNGLEFSGVVLNSVPYSILKSGLYSGYGYYNKDYYETKKHHKEDN